MEKILIFDFGSQYTQLIARKIRELSVYCEIVPYYEKPDFQDTKGIILSGSPFSVLDNSAPKIELSDFPSNIPILGICYGAQLIAHLLGGYISKSEKREYGRANLIIKDKANPLLNEITEGSQIWMSHGDSITSVPDNFLIIASTNEITCAAYQIKNTNIFGVQFHPEVYHTTEGNKLLNNFLKICNCQKNWTPESFIEKTIKEIKEKVKDEKVVLGLSGGVDSSVTALLIHNAIGKNLYCIFIDNGLLRKNEFSKVLETYKKFNLNIKGIDASALFIKCLQGIIDPEQKRKIIGKTFIDVFETEANKIENVKWLAQGTIYPDVIESKSVKGPSQTIKSHHNVGGLPEKIKLKILEPLNSLFKDEVRKVGKALGLDEDILERHPFPGPGLAIRIIGSVTKEKLEILRQADYIFIEELKKWDLYNKVWQAGAIFLPIRSVGVMGDERTYENVICLRAVTSTDGMTADWAHLPYEFLANVSNKIINNVKGINRVVYDISSKPPSTIEWE